MNIVTLMENGTVARTSQLSHWVSITLFTEASSSVHNGMRRRNSRKYAKFFQLVNESIAKVAPGRVFDPVAGFMADEAGGLQEGPRRVFGSSVLEKLKTCEFHFLQCANRQRARLHSEKSKEFFTRVTCTLLQPQTSSAYNDAIVELKVVLWRKLHLSNLSHFET